MAFVVSVLHDDDVAADGNSAGMIECRGTTLCVELVVGAGTGTNPTLDVNVQWSMDGTTFYDTETAQSFTQITGSNDDAGYAKTFTVSGQYARLAFDVGGTTPSFPVTAKAYVTR